MARVETTKDANQKDGFSQLVKCSECGQKLMDIEFAGGLTVQRIKCRRCKQYIKVLIRRD